eukprot:6420943-Amphidinium_carterae.1
MPWVVLILYQEGDTKVEYVMAQDTLAGLHCFSSPDESVLTHTRSTESVYANKRAVCLRKPFVWTVIATAFFGVFICLSVLGLLVKLMFVHFAVRQPPWEWSVRECILFSGFLSQLAGICDVNHIEVMRVLCFKFGGADSYWNWQD